VDLERLIEVVDMIRLVLDIQGLERIGRFQVEEVVDKNRKVLELQVAYVDDDVDCDSFLLLNTEIEKVKIEYERL
jgi:hypothetical protein